MKDRIAILREASDALESEVLADKVNRVIESLLPHDADDDNPTKPGDYLCWVASEDGDAYWYMECWYGSRWGTTMHVLFWMDMPPNPLTRTTE